ncbi:hypothetical protein [Candidatus Ichthyocystis sparus]|uniref:hypothetical protein n=1 Tax=Candidatus Ichthyocystis sparus TaxID=1561004 RepID=UPI000B86C234|nr:hypothetical protein [Candidatus Ichthyocystis sparus]
MSDRVVRNVDSGSNSGAGRPTGNVGGDDSSLRAVDQDRDGESGRLESAGRSSRGSLASPGHVESRELGAKPRKRAERKEEKAARSTGKGVEWNKKDRKAAKLHKGKGQKIAAERAAEPADRCEKVTTTATTRLYQPVRVLGTGPRTRHGPGCDQPSRKKTSTDVNVARDLFLIMSMFAFFFSFFTYDLLASESSDLARGAITGLKKTAITRLVALLFTALLALLAMLIGTLSGRRNPNR